MPHSEEIANLQKALHQPIVIENIGGARHDRRRQGRRA
jgi:hypothetical protein